MFELENIDIIYTVTCATLFNSILIISSTNWLDKFNFTLLLILINKIRRGLFSAWTNLLINKPYFLID